MTLSNAPRGEFYRDVVDRCIPDRNSTILIVCGGESDRRLFLELGFTRVTITNLNPQGRTEAFHPFDFARQDAENLRLEDESFDFVVVNAGLHHCAAPHRALLEMYRVARLGAIVVEARDSVVMRAATRLKLTTAYEVYPVTLGSTGLRDTDSPNYVYRWTEREVRKTVASYAPHVRNRIRFFYGLSLPAGDDSSAAARAKQMLVRAAAPIAKVMFRVLPSQGNLFGFCITKPDLPGDLQSWMELDGGRPRFRMALRKPSAEGSTR